MHPDEATLHMAEQEAGVYDCEYCDHDPCECEPDPDAARDAWQDRWL